MAASKGKVGHLVYGTEGEPRLPALIAYYHRAEKLQEAAGKAGYDTVQVCSRRTKSDVSAVRRMFGSAWLREAFADCNVVYAASSDCAAMAAWAFRNTDIPVIYDIHTPPVGEKLLEFRLRRTARTFAIYLETLVTEWISIKKSDYILWSSLIQRDLYLRRGFPAERLREVRHGVDLEKFCMRPMPQDGKRKLVYAGTMVPYQGADRLVRAFERFGNERLSLKMIGFTQADEPLRKAAESVGVETVQQVPREALPGQLAECHATIICAHENTVKYKNGAAPTKWPEYLAVGRPILSVNAYDTAQLIRDLKVGWVVQNTIDGLVSGMGMLAAAAHSDLEEMGLRARSEAEANYSWEKVGGKYVSVLEEAKKR